MGMFWFYFNVKSWTNLYKVFAGSELQEWFTEPNRTQASSSLIRANTSTSEGVKHYRASTIIRQVDIMNIFLFPSTFDQTTSILITTIHFVFNHL